MRDVNLLAVVVVSFLAFVLFFIIRLILFHDVFEPKVKK